MQCAFKCIPNFYKVQYKHTKRTRCKWSVCMFVSNFLGYVSAKILKNLIKSDKNITKNKKGELVFETQYISITKIY